MAGPDRDKPAQTAPEPVEPRQPGPRRRGLFARLMEVLGSGEDPERAKRRLLKDIAREVAKSRSEYYTPRGGAAGPGLAKLLHSFYCALGPAQTLLESAGSSEALRTMVIESRMAPADLELRESLTEEAIASLAQSSDPPRLADVVKGTLARFSAAYSPRIPAINAHLRDFSVLLDLISFDYYTILRRFDPSLPAADYAYVPRFSPVDAEYVAHELRDFAEVLAAIDPAGDWNALFDTLKEYRRVDAVSRDAWRKLLHTVDRLGRTNLLLNLVRLMEQDPRATVTPRAYGGTAAEEYLERVRMKAELALQRSLSQKRNAKIDEMVVKTFGRIPEQRLSRYTAAANPGLEKRGAAGYSHAAPLNYLKVYLADYLEPEVKKIADLLLVKGQWATPLSSHALSDALQACLKVTAQLAELDESLADDGARGRKVKEAVAKAGRNKNEAYVLRQTLRGVNESARAVLGGGMEALVALGKMWKALLDDLGAKEPHLVQNWREIDALAESQLKSRFLTGYTRLYNLVKLLGQYRDVHAA